MAIVLNNSVNANIFYYKMNQCEERTYATAVEMAARIHMLDDGTIKKIAIIGHSQSFDEEYYMLPEGARQLGALRSVNRNLMCSATYIPLYLGNVLDFQLSYYLDHPEKEIPKYETAVQDPVSEAWSLEFPVCDTKTVEKLEKSDFVKAMDTWPAAGSVQVTGDTVVIKLSDTKEE